MTASLSVTEREHLAQQYATDLAPKLRAAIDKQDHRRITELIGDLDRQHLLILVVALASRWPAKTKPRPRKYVTCRGCGEKKRHEGHGLCRGCHIRWDAAGRPASGPPPRIPAVLSGFDGAVARIEEKRERLEDYADFASWGEIDEVAAQRLGVSVRTVHRYRTQLETSPVQLRIAADHQQRKAS